MKCNCNYIHLYEYEISYESDWGSNKELKEKLEKENSREPFIRIKGTFLIEEDYGRVKETTLYACPKCGALKINLD